MISQVWRNALVGQIDNVLFLASLIVRSKCAWLTVTVRMAAVCGTLPILLLNMYALLGGLVFGGFGRGLPGTTHCALLPLITSRLPPQ